MVLHPTVALLVPSYDLLALISFFVVLVLLAFQPREQTSMKKKWEMVQNKKEKKYKKSMHGIVQAC